MIAPWLKQHLEDTGVWNTDGVSVRGKVRRHPCGRYVVVVLSDGMWPVVVDITPLSPLGEALAVLAGRSTFALRDAGNRVEVDIRSAIEIKGSPAGTERYDVVAAHECLSTELPSVPSQHRQRIEPTQCASAPF